LLSASALAMTDSAALYVSIGSLIVAIGSLVVSIAGFANSQLRRLEDLSSEFFALAKRDKCRDSAHIFARLNERICAMRGWSPINVRMDPLEVQVAEKSSDSYDKIYNALLRVARRKDQQLDGNGQSGAVDALSPPDDAETSH